MSYINTAQFLQRIDIVLIQFLERFQVVLQHLHPLGRDFSLFLHCFDRLRTKLRERCQRARILQFRAELLGDFTPLFLSGLVDLYTVTLVNHETVLDAFLGEIDHFTSQSVINHTCARTLNDIEQIHNLLFSDIDILVDFIREVARNTIE